VVVKYLFIILIAFSFIGCDDEDGENNTNPNRTIFATFTMMTNMDNISIMSANCIGQPSSQESSGSTDIPLPNEHS
jgi:hypothetical protein